MSNAILKRRVSVLTAALGITAGSLAIVAQVKTNVPDPVAGARPAIVERIKIHGTALEGNLEGDTVDRDVIVFLPPSYNQNRTRRYPVVYALHGYSIGTEKNPPLYIDLPIGEQAQAVLAKWAANAPLAFVDQYVLELKRYRAIAIDVGDQDGLRVDAGKLHDVLDQYVIANAFEVYPGTHTSDVAVRFQEHVMPFFSRTLSFEPAKR